VDEDTDLAVYGLEAPINIGESDPSSFGN